MKIRIVTVDFELSRRTKRGLVLGTALVAAVVASRVVVADVPHTFESGDVLSAKAMNDNFAAIDQRIASGRAIVSTDGGAYSVGFTRWCGVGGNPNGSFAFGGRTGYAAGKAICEAANGCSPSAHMCTSEEIVRLAQVGASPATPGWISTGVNAVTTGNTTELNDCDGWTRNTNPSSGAAFGTLWTGSAVNGFMGFAGCSEQHPVLCCD